MWNFGLFVKACLLLSLFFGSIFYQQDDKTQKKTVKRVKRPSFENSDRNDIYFDDVLAEGTVGQRPSIADIVPEKKSETGNSTALPSVGSQWSKIASRDVIEDEIKSLHQELQSSITTPSGFNSKFREVRQKLEMLSMLFGVIHEYDQEIRWKKYAGSFQLTLAETSLKIRTPNRPTFQAARATKDDLGELIRGGGVTVKDDLPTRLSWPKVVQRTPIMIQLEEIVGNVLKPAIANEEDFNDRQNELMRNASLVAVMARALTLDGMDDADDDSYVEFAEKMGAVSRQLLLSVRDGEYESSAAAVNKIEQSCADCHEEWR